jgi:hypothetical protein
MRTFLILILAAVGLGVTTFGVYYSWQKPATAAAAPAAVDELEWLRREFNLSEEQMARVRTVHAEYAETCEFYCALVLEAQDRLEEKLVSADGFTPEVEEALARFSRVKEDCHRSMLQHVYEIAAVMEPEQRKRYLMRAKAQVTMHDRVSR